MTDNDGVVEMPNGCPPQNASPSDGVYYRLTARNLAVGDQPDETDWQLPYQKRRGECAGRPDLCECHAHSLFTDVQDVEFARAATPWARKKSVSLLSLSPSSGVAAASHSGILPSHHDWWPRDPFAIPDAVVVMGSVE